MYLRLYRPFVFQGNLNNKHYFEGWYFKHVSADKKNTWSFIPGISLSNNDSHAFIQVIDGVNGISEYIRFPLSEFEFDYKKMCLRVGQSVFSENGIDLNIETGKAVIHGEIQYHKMVKYPQTIFSPGIMGWYSFVPFMECKHGIISVNHTLSGSLSVNGNSLNFEDGKGYIEKDWGSSFPEAWIWIQSNHFSNYDTSFSFSIAKIPWLRKFFIGFITYVYYGNRFYLFSTYNGSAITGVTRENEQVRIIIEGKKYKLHINTKRNTSGELLAPSLGEMSRRIKESINSEVSLKMLDKDNNLIFEDAGYCAGLEITDKIFDYL
jgi:tocopherol cyclase